MGPTSTSIAAPEEEGSLQERYDKMVHELVCERSWTPRKARRYLDSIARRRAKKTMKKGLGRPKIDVSDITPESVEA